MNIIDRRVVRTKRMIRDALTDLMEEKGFEGITVRDLTTKADINRGTFYIHYQDKYDLLKQSENEILQEIDEIAKSVQQQFEHSNLKKTLELNEPFPFVIKLFEYLADNAAFMKVLLGPKGNPSFQKELKEVIRKNLHQVIESKLGETLVPVEILSTYVSSAHLGVVQHWLESGSQMPPREMALILLRITVLGPAHVAGLMKQV